MREVRHPRRRPGASMSTVSGEAPRTVPMGRARCDARVPRTRAAALRVGCRRAVPVGRGRLSGRRRHRRGGPPRRPPGQARPGGGARRHRQDRARQIGGTSHRQPAHPPAVLRGARRIQGPLRVELQEAAASHPGPAGDRGRRRDVYPRPPGTAGRSSRRTSSPRSSCWPGLCSKPSVPPSRWCCWSTRSTASSSRPRPCCSRSCRSTRCRSPSSARCGPSASPSSS